ncbi:MAG: general stress protein [Thermoanaerobacteraceae bacterium]|nr:general stress protein [Thermoanaerobacteraceae bacterium]
MSTRRTIVGVFNGVQQAVEAVKQIEDKGLANSGISLVTPMRKLRDTETADEVSIPGIDALEGWLVQVGEIDLPDVGTVTAGGPFAGAISQPDKNISDALNHYGVSASAAKKYQQEVKNGKILAVIETNNDKANQTVNLLRELGAKVEKWSKNKDKPGRRG